MADALERALRDGEEPLDALAGYLGSERDGGFAEYVRVAPWIVEGGGVSGQNSIASLQRFRFHCVITDRSCMHDIRAQDQNVDMIKALNACCDALGTPLVVSGVDRADDLACLEELGCRLVQGSGIAAPASAAAMPE